MYAIRSYYALLVLLQVLSEDGRRLSEMRREYEPYAQSGEINFEVEDKSAATDSYNFV